MNTTRTLFHIDEHVTLLVSTKKIELSKEVAMERIRVGRGGEETV